MNACIRSNHLLAFHVAERRPFYTTPSLSVVKLSEKQKEPQSPVCRWHASTISSIQCSITTSSWWLNSRAVLASEVDRLGRVMVESSGASTRRRPPNQLTEFSGGQLVAGSFVLIQSKNPITAANPLPTKRVSPRVSRQRHLHSPSIHSHVARPRITACREGIAVKRLSISEDEAWERSPKRRELQDHLTE